MKVLSSAHVHTTYCDGKTPAPLMARAALEKGFVSLGFSSHAPQRFDPGYCVDTEKEEEAGVVVAVGADMVVYEKEEENGDDTDERCKQGVEQFGETCAAQYVAVSALYGVE